MPRAKKAPVAPYNTGNNETAKPPVPTGRAYGARAATETALQAVPAAGPSADMAAPTAGTPPASDAALLQAATDYQAPLGGLTDPSQNPNEPVTAGLPSGPGAGPEALSTPDPNAADMQTWAAYLPTLEYLASLPGSTSSTRNFVRRLRSALPPQQLQ